MRRSHWYDALRFEPAVALWKFTALIKCVYVCVSGRLVLLAFAFGRPSRIMHAICSLLGGRNWRRRTLNIAPSLRGARFMLHCYYYDYCGNDYRTHSVCCCDLLPMCYNCPKRCRANYYDIRMHSFPHTYHSHSTRARTRARSPPATPSDYVIRAAHTK